MDNFSELDDEIRRLKMEMQSPGRNRPTAPPLQGESDYWKNRLADERRMNEARMQEQSAEKKDLEEKVAEQQLNIARYEQLLKDAALKFQSDAHQLENRLLLRESELLMEQRRILDEEKIKIAGVEKEHLAARLDELSKKIAGVTEDAAAAASRAAAEKEQARQEIESLLAMIAKLKDSINESTLTIREKELDIAAAAENNERIAREIAEKEQALETQKSFHAAELAALKKRTEEAVAQARDEASRDTRRFMQKFGRLFGPLAATAERLGARPDAAPDETVMGELADKLEKEAQSYAAALGVSAGADDPFLAVVLGGEEDAGAVTRSAGPSGATVHLLSARRFMAEIADQKPRVAVVAGAGIRKSARIVRAWPFLPVVIVGAMPARLRPWLKKGTIHTTPAGGDPAALREAIIQAASHSVARPEYWDRLVLRRRRRWVSLAAAGLLLAAGAGFGGYQRFVAVPAVVTTAYASPTNFTYEGQRLWVCDWYGQAIHEQTVRGSIKRSVNFPNRHFTALTWANGYLWTCDSWTKMIYKHKADDALTIVAAYPAPGSAPSGTAWDGRNLLTCDSGSGEIYRHKADGSMTVESAYRAPCMSPAGLYWDGASLWSLDAKNGVIYRHRSEEDFPVAAEYRVPVPAGEKASGITGDGKNLWVCSEKSGKIYRCPTDKLIARK